MSNAMTMQVTSPQRPTSTGRALGQAGHESDGPSAGAAGFDAVLADHAVPQRSPQAEAKRARPVGRASADKNGAAYESGQGAKASSAKRTVPDEVRPGDDPAALGSIGRAAPAAANPAYAIAAAATLGDRAGAAATSPGATGAAATPPGAIAPDVTSGSVALAPVGPGLVVLPGLSDVVPALVPPTAAGTTAPTLVVAEGQVTAAAGGGAVAVPGRTGPEAPTAPGLGVVPGPPTPDPGSTPATVPGSSAVAPTPAPAAALAAKNGHTTATALGDGVVVSGHGGPAAPSPGSSSPGQPVDSATAVTWTAMPQVTDAVPPSGPPTAPSPGVVPGLSTVVAAPTVVPIATPSGSPSAPVTGPALLQLPEPLHLQVYTALSPLIRGADGSYGIQLSLRPHDLGTVQVNLDIRHGEISIQMNATDPAARDALREGLSDLRQQLEDQGLRAGSMDVGSGGAHARQPETSRPRSQGIELPVHGRNPSDQLAPRPAASSTALDLRM